jgi:hypothetical protein
MEKYSSLMNARTPLADVDTAITRIPYTIAFFLPIFDR